MSLYNALHTNDRRNTPTGHWINEAFVLRLYAVLEAHRVIGKRKRVQTTLPGSEWLALCKRIRDRIAHTTGDVVDDESEQLEHDIRTHAGIPNGPSIPPGKLPLPRDRVLRPMHGACIEYCRALLAAERTAARHAV